VRLSVIIPAYNEQDTIELLLAKVKAVALPEGVSKEIIVVNDGSTDDTGARAQAYPSVSVISYDANRGKSYALARGVAAARCEHVMLLDADLDGLSASHTLALAAPVLTGAADISISLRGNSLGLYRVIGLDFVSGERVLPRRLLLAAAETIMQLPKWACEVFINQLIIEQGLRIAVVDWREVTHTPKRVKMGHWRGAVEDLEMMGDALRVLTPVGVVRQNLALLKLARRAA